MLELIYGSPGSGKTSETLNRMTGDLRDGRECILLVPEQQVVLMERLCTARTETLGMATLGFDLLSFRRLANRIFREYGGLCYHYIDKGGQLLILWQVFSALAPFLKEYRNVQLHDSSVISTMLTELKTLKRAGITPAMLEETAGLLKTEKEEGVHDRLAGKLQDLALLYSGYEALLQKGFDDPEEDLPRVCRFLDLPDHDFFRGKKVYLDGFSDLTGQEYELLRRILRSAETVTVTLGKRRGDKDKREFLSKVKDFESVLLRLAREELPRDHRILFTELPDGDHRAALLRYLERNFANISAPSGNEPPPKDSPAFHAICCASPYEEAEALAARILMDVRSGGRFRDHAVAVRDPGMYAGIIESVFERCSIPCFFSVQGNLLTKAAVRAIFSALDILRGGWRTEDVIGYIKTGFSGITAEEAFLLEEYARTWSIRGKRWYDEIGFTMNPEGYSDRFTEESEAQLVLLGKLREKIAGPLTAFFEAFRPAEGEGSGKLPAAASLTKALYTFLVSLGMENKLREEAENARRSGRGEDAEALAQLWNAICDALDTVFLAAGELACTPTLYSQILQTVFSSMKLGSIPTAVDEVLFSDALLLRGEGIRHMHLLGVNEGVFPGKVEENGIFADSDLLLMEELGLKLPGNTVKKSEEELHSFYLALSMPSESLTVSFSAANLKGEALEISQSLSEILSLLGEKAEKYTALPIEKRIFDAESCLAQALMNGTTDSELRVYCRSNDRLREKFDRLQEGISAGNDRIVPPHSSAVLYLTQSRIEKFVRCPLAYTLRYVLRLGREKSAEAGPMDVGNIMHLLLEKFLRKQTAEKAADSKKEITDEEISDLISSILEEYIGKVCGGDEPSPRLAQLLRRTKITAFLLLSDMRDEFRQSEFLPVCFELQIGGKGERKEGELRLPPLSIALPDGGRVLLTGAIDRVDILKKEKDVYLRVVDYKTGGKDFSREDLDKGLNMQMPLYMLALCESDDPAFDALTGREEGGKYLPAAVLYHLAKRPSLSLQERSDDAAVLAQSKKKIERRGLVLADEEILQAMAKEPKGSSYLPVGTFGKGGKYGKATYDAEEFESLLKELPSIVSGIACRIRDGAADASPLADACSQCEMRPACRRRTGDRDEENGQEE